MHLPNAKICFDSFRLVKIANEAVDALCRAEVAREPALKRTGYHWLDAHDWTRKEIDLHWLRQSSPPDEFQPGSRRSLFNS